MVSIIMPAYNCEKYIAGSIESVQKQTFRDWELLVVDDFSTDGTAAVVKRYAAEDARIKLLSQPENTGAAATRNRAIDEAKGEYLAFLDSDDIWYPEKLEKQLAFMEENNYSFTCSAYQKINEADEPLGKPIRPYARADYKKCLYYGNCLGNSTVIYRLGSYGKPHVPPIRKRNDFALWLQILRHEPCVYGLDEVLAGYRVREDSLSSGKFGLIKYQWQLYREVEKLSLPRTLFAFATLFARKVFVKIFH